MTTTLSKKSGKGLSNGMLSELSAFLRVKPGHAEQLEAAIQRFGAATHGSGPKAGQRSAGLRDVRFVIYDNGQRLLWTTSFETDWDAYIDDAIAIFGADNFFGWIQHTAEFPEGTQTVSNAEIKEFLQSVQVQAAFYFDALSNKTLPEIKKAMRVEQAFEQVLDNPEVNQALQHPALRPLAELAAN
jgi:hypothetical protein